MGARTKKDSAKEEPKKIDSFAKAYLRGDVKDARFHEKEGTEGFFSYTLDVAYETRNKKVAHAYLRCMADGSLIEDMEDGQILNGIYNVMTGSYEDKNGVKHYTTTFSLREINEAD